MGLRDCLSWVVRGGRPATNEERSATWSYDPVALLGAVAVEANIADGPVAALGRAGTEILRQLGWPLGHAYEVDERGELRPTDVWLGVDATGRADLADFRAVSDGMSQADGSGLPGRVVATGAAAWIEDVRVDPNFPRAEAAGRAGLRAAFAFPILADGRVKAVLEFFCHDVVPADPRFLEVVEKIGVQLGVVFEREHARGALEASRDRTRRVLDSAGHGFIAMDADGRVTEWNEAAEAIFGWSRADAVGRKVAELIVPPELREAHEAGLSRFLRTTQPSVLGQRLELPAMRADGRRIPLEITLWSLTSETGWEFYAFCQDITERKQAEDELAYRANHDELTGLPNRSVALSVLEAALGRPDEETGVLFIDLDRFKKVNDSLGHDGGDRLLTIVAERLRAAVRPEDLVARLAGDEFVVVCRNVADVGELEEIASRIARRLADPVDVGSDSIRIGASVGICLASTHATAEDLLRDSDLAMYEAKTTERGCYRVFDSDMRSRATERLRLERDLHGALDGDQLRVHYQPLIDIPSSTVIGVEALLRWQHPELGLLAPDSFIPLAEDSGLIVPIGEWVLKEACRQAEAWELAGLGPFEMAVNLSGRQLAQTSLPDIVDRVLATSGVRPGQVQLCLEITESLLMADPEAAATMLRTLKDLGVSLAIDDFGTGYSSLAYLKWFPVDTVKIDRSFIAGLEDSRADHAIIKAVVELAHALDITVVAEGIETEGQAAVLRATGCDRAQGFLFSRPLPPEALTSILELPGSRVAAG